MPDQTVARTMLFRLRVSIRTLMVLVLVIGGALGWFAHLAAQARLQRNAVAAVRNARGAVVGFASGRAVMRERTFRSVEVNGGERSHEAFRLTIF